MNPCEELEKIVADRFDRLQPMNAKEIFRAGVDLGLLFAEAAVKALRDENP